MAQIIEKGDLSAASFANNNTANAGGITIRIDPASTVGAAIVAAIAAVPNAGDLVRGLVQLATLANHPQPTNDVDAATPAYVMAVVDAAVAALPADKFLQGLQSYNPATNIMTLLMSDATTVNVDLTGLLTDAVSSLTAGAVVVQNNAGVNIGYLMSSPLPTV